MESRHHSDYFGWLVGDADVVGNAEKIDNVRTGNPFPISCAFFARLFFRCPHPNDTHAGKGSSERDSD
jgi:hypothetical protein